MNPRYNANLLSRYSKEDVNNTEVSPGLELAKPSKKISKIIGQKIKVREKSGNIKCSDLEILGNTHDLGLEKVNMSKIC
jgi:hypothetical protein